MHRPWVFRKPWSRARRIFTRPVPVPAIPGIPQYMSASIVAVGSLPTASSSLRNLIFGEDGIVAINGVGTFDTVDLDEGTGSPLALDGTEDVQITQAGSPYIAASQIGSPYCEQVSQIGTSIIESGQSGTPQVE